MSLSPSERIALKKQIAERLDQEPWSMIDLTLSEFSLATTSDFSGNGQEYVLAMIKKGDDNTLIHLGQHLGIKVEFSVTAPQVEPTFWPTGTLRIFLSHLSSHKVWAAELQSALSRFGIYGFVAHTDIEPTLEWQNQIERALATCDSLVALLHKDFHVSIWTDQEIGFAMGRGVPVFSVRLGADPYGFIGKFQGFNGAKKEPLEIAEELFNAYRTNKQTQAKMADVLLTLFKESGSFAEAKARIGYLEQLETWEPTFSARIRSAAESNSQINGSWGTPARAEALAKKWEKKP